MHTIGVDIGGTKIAAGVVDDAGKIIERIRRDTPALDPAAIDDVVASSVLELLSRHEASAVGVAAAGFVDAQRSTVMFAPNLAMRNHQLKQRIADRVPLPVFVENDANAAGWAEFQFGSGRNVRDMVMITVGTGLGSAVVVDGKLVRGAFGAAAELGHMRVVPQGRYCGCGHDGCWEQYASGSALEAAAEAAAIARYGEAAALIEIAGGYGERITGPMVTELAAAGDELAIELVAEIGKWLGEGIAALAAMLDPEVVVIGGGVSAAGELLLAPARAAFSGSLSARGYRPELQIVGALMGNDAGIVGAADLARQ